MGRVADALRQEVYRANMALARSGLVMGTFGNVSGIDRAAGLMAIKARVVATVAAGRVAFQRSNA